MTDQIFSPNAQQLDNFNMNDMSLLKKDLQKLQKYQNSHIKSLISPPIRIGFNQKKKPTHRRLLPLLPNADSTLLQRAEKELLKEIRQIDTMLQNKYSLFKYHNGYLFSLGLSHDLSHKFAQLVASKCQAIESGFAIWRLHDEEGVVHLVSGKLSNSPKHFKQQITDKSLEKLQSYNVNKYQQSLKYAKEPWKHFSKVGEGRRLRIKTEADQQERGSHIRKTSDGKAGLGLHNGMYRKLTEMSNYNSSSIQQSSIISKIHPFAQQRDLVSSTPTVQLSFRSDKHQHGSSFMDINPLPSKQELQKMLLKENKIVSIWVPPSNYAQLVSLFSIQIRQREPQVRVCWIIKYYCPRHALSRKIFNCMLDWAVSQYGYIAQLCLTTTKNYFDSVFSNLGWKISGWINDEKIRIIYKKSLH